MIARQRRRRRRLHGVARSWLTRLGVAALAGGLFYASFPPVNWWWAAVPAFALLAWVLTDPATTLAGGAAYGLVFGLAFYLPLVPWAGAFAGKPPWLGLAMLGAVFTPVFGLTAVAVRGLAGWPVWFAVLWPENSADIDPLLNPDAGRQISVAADAIGAPILVGALLAVPHTPWDNPAYTNTVIVWDPVAGPGERHTKQFVQPFGEYMPMPWLFSHLSAHAHRAGYIVPGKSTGVVHVAGVPVGVGTCWEVAFDRALRQSVRSGAQLLAAPVNNATFGKVFSEQQLAFAKLRAAELDRYVVVASTTGISAVIAPDGHELARTGYFAPAYLDLPVHLKTDLTPAARWGALVQWTLIAVAAAAVLVAAVRRRRMQAPRPADAGRQRCGRRHR